jgi:hypothetical protein
MLEFLGSRFNYHIGQFDYLIKNISLTRISRCEKLERKKMYLRKALDSAHFHRMRKVTIQLLHAQEKLGRYNDINSQSYLSIVN